LLKLPNLKWVEEQTEELCATAVAQNGNVLCLIENQTNEICLKAFKYNGLNLFNVKNKTHDIYKEAIKQNHHVLMWAEFGERKKSENTCIIM